MAAHKSFGSRCVGASFALVGIAVMVALWWGPRQKIVHGWNDFVAFYAGAQLAGSPDLYSPRRMMEVEYATTGVGGERLQFTRPPYYAVLLWPFGRLPYRVSYALWQALSLAAVVAFVGLWRHSDRWTVLWACSWSLPLSACFAQAQDSAFLLLWLVVLLRFYKDRPFLAGIVLSLCATKFHLFLLLPIVLVVQSRWRLASGLLAGAGAAVLLSFVAGGLSWPLAYYGIIHSDTVSPALTIMPNLHGLLAGVPRAGVLEVVLGALLAVAVALVARRASFEQSLAAALVGGLLVSVHAYPADGVIVIPACLLILAGSQGSGLRTLAVVLLTPVAWFGCIVGGPPATALRLSLIAVVAIMVWQYRGGMRKQSATAA